MTTGWPFWAATSDERIERAFDLAALQPGEHLVDLGCGDGRVLLRGAVLRGANVTGVELDAELAARARALLAEHDAVGAVIEADFADVRLDDADVVFAYLSPSTLQRLRPRLAATLKPGTRVVTTGYAVPGWEPVEAGGRCFLYRVPVQETEFDRSRRGWDGAGALISLRPDAPSLVAVKLHHGGGRVGVRISGDDLAAATVARTGADIAAAGDEVVVDLRFDPRPAGTRLAGIVDADGVDAPFQVFAIVDDGEPGLWRLSVGGCDAVADAVVSGDVTALLDEARATSR